jgi:hypothetical protein
MVTDLIVAKPPYKVGKYTGQVLLNTRPKTYRRIVELLAQGISGIQISKQCKVSRHSVHAVSERENATIDQRKRELTYLVSDIAHIGAARVADRIGKAATRDAIIGTGVAIDKLLALQGQTAGVQVAVVNMPSDADREAQRNLDAKLDAIAQRLNALP